MSVVVTGAAFFMIVLYAHAIILVLALEGAARLGLIGWIQCFRRMTVRARPGRADPLPELLGYLRSLRNYTAESIRQ